MHNRYATTANVDTLQLFPETPVLLKKKKGKEKKQQQQIDGLLKPFVKIKNNFYFLFAQKVKEKLNALIGFV